MTISMTWGGDELKKWWLASVFKMRRKGCTWGVLSEEMAVRPIDTVYGVAVKISNVRYVGI
jgi:hypothetical protein